MRYVWEYTTPFPWIELDRTRFLNNLGCSMKKCLQLWNWPQEQQVVGECVPLVFRSYLNIPGQHTVVRKFQVQNFYNNRLTFIRVCGGSWALWVGQSHFSLSSAPTQVHPDLFSFTLQQLTKLQPGYEHWTIVPASSQKWQNYEGSVRVDINEVP